MKNHFLNFILCILYVQKIFLGKVDIYSKDFNNFFYFDELLVENSLNKYTSGFTINHNNIVRLISILKRFDRLNSPKKEIVDGKIIYTYKKFPNEPKKSIKDIE